jgi:putative acetyltransferase
MRIIEAGEADFDAVMRVEREAFGRDDEPRLVAALLRDPTAQPVVSLLAFEAGRAIGHVLLTKATLDGATRDASAAILAPLAVIPAWQRRGVGRALIEHGAGVAVAMGVRLVFVLGDPGYYTRRGFLPAFAYGLRAPYPIVPAEAWMVRPLAPDLLGTIAGTVACAVSLARPEYWRE